MALLRVNVSEFLLLYIYKKIRMFFLWHTISSAYPSKVFRNVAFNCVG